MKLEFIVFGLTVFFIYNAYSDGKYTKMLFAYKKYYKMICYAGFGIGLYYMLKRNPANTRNMLYYANNMVKYMPIDKTSMDMLSPIIDFTQPHPPHDDDATPYNSFMENLNGISRGGGGGEREKDCRGGVRGTNNAGATKRCVSETKKKYVASNQNWTCGHCRQQLDHTFEIDHRIRLEYGGSNDVQNLVALCRNCHGKKTAKENMFGCSGAL